MNLSNAIHLQINRQVEWTIQTLEDMLRASVIDIKGKWSHGWITCHLLSSTIIKVIILSPKWIVLNLFMIEGVDHWLDGMKWVKLYYLGLERFDSIHAFWLEILGLRGFLIGGRLYILCTKRWKNLKFIWKDIRKFKVAKSHMLMRDEES